MKKKARIGFWLIMSAMIIGIAFSGCRKIECVDLNNEVDDNGITLKCMTSQGYTTSDSIVGLANKTYLFKVTTSFEATNIQVLLSNGVTIVPNAEGFFQNIWTNAGVSTLIITAIDVNGQSHSNTWNCRMLVAWNDPIKFMSVTPISGSNYYSVVMACSKNGIPFNGGDYRYTGSITVPIWQTTEIPVADTNYRIENNTLYAVPTGQVGSWICIRFNIVPGSYEMGVGKYKDGSLTWGSFYNSMFVPSSEPTLIKFSLSQTGVITSGATSSEMPGNIGDQGDGPVLRFEENENGTWNMYVNNNEPFSSLTSPFVKYLGNNEVWQSPILQSPVANYPNWGMVVLATPLPDDLRLQFGNNSNIPLNVNGTMSNSLYWDGRYDYLSVGFGNFLVQTVDNKYQLVRPIPKINNYN